MLQCNASAVAVGAADPRNVKTSCVRADGASRATGADMHRRATLAFQLEAGTIHEPLLTDVGAAIDTWRPSALFVAFDTKPGLAATSQ